MQLSTNFSFWVEHLINLTSNKEGWKHYDTCKYLSCPSFNFNLLRWLTDFFLSVSMIFSIDFYSLISQNQLDQNSLYKGNGSLGATGQTTKLHVILAATLKKSGGQ